MGSTQNPKATDSSYMDKSILTGWVKRLSIAKAKAKDDGRISGDIDLAAKVSDTLESIGQKKVERAAVNHWITGNRQPSVVQLLALCDALGVTPCDILDCAPSNITTLEDARIAEAVTLMRRAKDIDKERALAGVRVLLSDQTTQSDFKTGT